MIISQKNRSWLRALLLILLPLLTVSCSDEGDDVAAGRSYGYIQFKLYKEASYVASKADESATVSELDYLYDAKRIQVTMLYEGTSITQTVALSAYDETNSEYGLRTEKLLLLSGDYTVTGFTLYNITDQELYHSTMDPFSIVVPEGGMELYDLTAKAVERGRARFTFVKDFVATRSDEDLALLTSAYYAKLSLTHTTLSESVTFDSIPLSIYSVYDESKDNYQSMVLESDSLFAIKAGEWRVNNYSFYSSLNALLATDSPDNATLFEVEDNIIAEPQIAVTINESAEYIKDYIALKAIWEALDGENWSFYGESYPNGANWDFNRDIDLWGYQPGVMLHTNGRVASINLSEFGFAGDMPADIGQLTELVELYLGTHNDNNGDVYSARLSGLSLDGTLSKSRMDMAKAYVDSRIGDPLERAVSPLMRKAYIAAGKEAPGGLTVTQEEIDEQATGAYYTSGASRVISRADVTQGKYCNGLTSLPEEMGQLESLTTLFIANGKLTTLPTSLSQCEMLTDVEVYNCQDMTQFPMALAEIPYLVALNVAENPQWSAEELYAGLDALFSSPDIEYLQLLYINNNSLEEIPASMNNATNLSMLMATTCNISKLHAMPDFAPVQLFLDYNVITEVPSNFCNTEDVESISFSNNLITVMPDIFDKGDIPIESISFANNLINSIENDPGDGTAGKYNGVSTNSLDLSGNKFTTYPAIFALSESWVNAMNMSNNQLTGFEENSFVGSSVWYTESLDLSRNYLDELPDTINGINTPYLYGLDISYNSFDYVPYGPLNSAYVTIYILRGQRDSAGNRILKDWPTGITTHTGLVGLFIGSNDIREIDDTLSYLVYLVDISDNPNLIFDASSLCPYIEAGYYLLYYDKSQDIRNCSYLGIY